MADLSLKDLEVLSGTAQPEMADTPLGAVRSEVEPDLFVGNNGLRIRMRKVSRFLLVDAGRSVKIPRPPVMMIEDKGRTEENPLDPDYLEALQDAKYQQSMKTITTMLALGTAPEEPFPKGIIPPNDDEWYEIIDSIDESILSTVKGNKRLRYAAWLKYIGLGDLELTRLVKELMHYSDLTLESDVGEAEANFRGKAQSNGHTQGAAIPEG